MNSFGKFIKMSVKSKLVRQKTAAYDLGITEKHLSRTVNGRVNPSVHMLRSSIDKGYLTREQVDIILDEIYGKRNNIVKDLISEIKKYILSKPELETALKLAESLACSTETNDNKNHN